MLKGSVGYYYSYRHVHGKRVGEGGIGNRKIEHFFFIFCRFISWLSLLPLLLYLSSSSKNQNEFTAKLFDLFECIYFINISFSLDICEPSPRLTMFLFFFFNHFTLWRLGEGDGPYSEAGGKNIFANIFTVMQNLLVSFKFQAVRKWCVLRVEYCSCISRIYEGYCILRSGQ